MLISPLRYSGGKSRMYKQIKQYFPKNKNTMIDLFFGGGSVGINWLNDNLQHTLIANDIDNNLMNFWNKVQDSEFCDYWNKSRDLTQNLEKTKMIFNKKREDYSGFLEYYLCRMRWINYNEHLEYLVRNKCSFNGIGIFSEQAFNQNFNSSTFDRIEKCHELLKRAKLWNLDYKMLLKAGYWWVDTFFYLDPPYMIKNAKRLYKYGEFNHYELLENLKKFKGKWVLSINDCEEIREMYKDFNIYEINTTYTSSNNNGNKCKKVKELVITNFKE